MSDAWTQTYSGRAFDLLEPDRESVHVEDIAHALAMTCRYTGHTRFHYSVAEHSVLMSRYLYMTEGPYIALDALLHDASEYVVGDISRPVQLALGPDARSVLKALHDRVTGAIYLGLNIPSSVPHYSAPVRDADSRILLTERSVLLTDDTPRPWGIDGPPLPVTVYGWDAKWAEARWHHTFESLMDEVK